MGNPNWRWLLVAIAVAALVCGATAYAQEQVGSIEGVVADKDGVAVPGATVEAVAKSSGQTLMVVSDSNGKFRFPRLLADSYKLVAKLQGFVTAEIPNVDLALGKNLKVNFTLNPGAYEESVTVTADKAIIDVTQAQTAMNISKESIELMPHGRDFTSLVTQAPGASNESFLGGISIDGASGSENRFVIDGVDTTNPQDGVSGQLLISDFVEEVQVKSAGYAAEYGGSLGGVINAITKSGTNMFSGSVGTYYSSSSMEGKERKSGYEAWCDHPDDPCYRQYKKDKYTRWEPGFTLGGPVLKEKLWFFVAYQPAILKTERKPDGWTQSKKQDRTDEYITANLKGNIGQSFLYKVALNMSPTKIEGVLPARDGTTPLDTNFNVTNKYPTESYSLYGDFVASEAFLASVRIGYFMYDTKTTGVNDTTRYFFRNGKIPVPTDDPRYRPTGFSSVPGGSFNSTDKDRWTTDSYGADGSWFFDAAGSHQVKFGAQYNKIKNVVSTGENGNLFEIRWGLADRFGAGVKGTYGSVHVRRFRTEGQAESTNWAIFLQDSWAPISNLTFNYGVRAEQERVPNYGARRDPTLPKNAISFDFKDKMAPRFGFAWDVMGDQKVKVYGSYGKYYDITKLEMPRGSFGADRWIAYLYPLNTLDWQTLNQGCTIATNDPSINPCPALGTPVTRDLRHPTDPRTAIDPNLKPMSQREYQIGAEYLLTPTSVASFRYVNKSLIDTIEDIGYLDAEGNEIYTTGNPGKGLVACKSDSPFPCPKYPQAKAIRDYQAFELTYNRRFADNWMFFANYTYSQLKGNYSGLASSDEFGRTDPNVARYFDGWVYGYDSKGHIVDGVLNTDRPHAVKLQGLYRFNFGTSVGVLFNWKNGTPTTTDVSYNGVNFFPNGRNDLGRTPNINQTDLFIQHPIKLGNFDLEFNVNIINLFDQKAVTRYENNHWDADVCDAREDCDTTNAWYFGTLVPYDVNTVMKDQPVDPMFKKAIAWQGPRTIRLGVKLTF